MNDHAGVKLFFANAGAWIGAIISLQNVQVVIAILSGLASIGVSILSMLWLHKKVKGLDNSDDDAS